MLMMQAAMSLQHLFSYGSMLPVAGGAVAGLAFAFFRSPVRPFGVRESESLMQFSSLGTLRCICHASDLGTVEPDRRQFCRSCGCEVAAVDRGLLDREVSQREARRLTRELRDAAIRASRLELPPSITSVAALQGYLAGDAKKRPRQMAIGQSAMAVE